MAIFYYKAKSSNGALETGQIDGETIQQATAKIQAKGLFPLLVQTEDDFKKASGGLASTTIKVRKRIRIDDIATFNRQLADLIGSGIPLVKALNVLQTQTANPSLTAIIAQVSSDVSGGDSLADAMAKHPTIFSKLFVAMVRSGEAGGMLDKVLERLADFTERDAETRAKLKAALAYPVFLVVAGSGAILILMTWVMPKILDVYKQTEQALPGPTQALLSINEFISSWWWALIILFGIIIGVITNALKRPEGKTFIDRIVIKTPLFGAIVTKQEIANFARTLGSLLHNGVNIIAALDIVHGVLTNKVIADEVKRIPDSIKQGEGVSATLSKGHIFPPVVVNMIAIGEETGRLDEVLVKIAASNEMEVNRQMKTLTSLMEPLILVIMGGIVGFIVIAMLMPIVGMDPTSGE